MCLSRSGAGSTPYSRRMLAIVLRPTSCPRLAIAPWIRVYPHRSILKRHAKNEIDDPLHEARPTGASRMAVVPFTCVSRVRQRCLIRGICRLVRRYFSNAMIDGSVRICGEPKRLGGAGARGIYSRPKMRYRHIHEGLSALCRGKPNISLCLAQDGGRFLSTLASVRSCGARAHRRHSHRP